jgi:hypothetical protein
MLTAASIGSSSDLRKRGNSHRFLKQRRYPRPVDEERLTHKSILRLAGLAAASLGIGSWLARDAQVEDRLPSSQAPSPAS